MDLLVSSQPPVRASARRLGRVTDRAGVGGGCGIGG